MRIDIGALTHGRHYGRDGHETARRDRPSDDGLQKALQESNGDFDLAKQRAREAGIKIMSIRQDRATEEGRLAVYAS